MMLKNDVRLEVVHPAGAVRTVTAPEVGFLEDVPAFEPLVTLEVDFPLVRFGTELAGEGPVFSG